MADRSATAPGRRPGNGHGDEHGSTLLLFPAAILVLMALAAIAVDLSALHLARRELLRSASQATDDAAAMLDRAELRRSGVSRLDQEAATRVVRFELAAANLPGTLVGAPTLSFDDSVGAVTVVVSMEVDPVFGAVVGRGPQRITVTATGRLLETP